MQHKPKTKLTFATKTRVVQLTDFTKDFTGIVATYLLVGLLASNCKELTDQVNMLVTLDQDHLILKVVNSVLKFKMKRIKVASRTSLLVGPQPISAQKLVVSNLTGNRESTCSQYYPITTTSYSIKTKARLKSHLLKDFSSAGPKVVGLKSVTLRKSVIQVQVHIKRIQDFSKEPLSKAMPHNIHSQLKVQLTSIRVQSETKNLILKS
jgi:hypothetical protein